VTKIVIGFTNFALEIVIQKQFDVQNMLSRDRTRFFDQVGHQTTNVSNGNKHFFTK
jgi:hypothetical protein